MAPKFPNAAVDAKTAHQARQQAARINRAIRQPHGHYAHDTLMVGYVVAIHDWGVDGLPPSLDVAPNGAHNLSSTAVMAKLQYVASYSPTVGDSVLVFTQPHGKSRSIHWVLGKVNGSASPYPTPLGHLDSSGRWIVTTASIWGGPGEPTIPQASGSVPGAVDGDYYFQTDEPATWSMFDGVWVPVTGGIRSTEYSTSGGTYTLQISDAGTAIDMASSTACGVHIPLNSSVPFAVGTVIQVAQIGAGQVTLGWDTGVTVQSPGGYSILHQYGTLTLRQRLANVWIVSGNV